MSYVKGCIIRYLILVVSLYPCDVSTYICQGCLTDAEAMIVPVLLKYM